MVRRPEYETGRRIDGATELARDPGARGVGPLIDYAPRHAARAAVDGVFLRRIVERQLVALAGERESPVADAVGEREQHRDAAARRAGALEQRRVAVKQVERLPLSDGVPAHAVEPQRRPHLRDAA